MGRTDSRIWILVYFVLMCEDADTLNIAGCRCDSFFSHDVKREQFFHRNFFFKNATMRFNSVSKIKCASVESPTQNWFRYESIKFTCMIFNTRKKNQFFHIMALHKLRVVNKTFSTTKKITCSLFYTLHRMHNTLREKKIMLNAHACNMSLI